MHFFQLGGWIADVPQNDIEFADWCERKLRSPGGGPKSEKDDNFHVGGVSEASRAAIFRIYGVPQKVKDGNFRVDGVPMTANDDNVWRRRRAQNSQ